MQAAPDKHTRAYQQPAEAVSLRRKPESGELSRGGGRPKRWGQEVVPPIGQALGLSWSRGDQVADEPFRSGDLHLLWWQVQRTRTQHTQGAVQHDTMVIGLRMGVLRVSGIELNPTRSIDSTHQLPSTLTRGEREPRRCRHHSREQRHQQHHVAPEMVSRQSHKGALAVTRHGKTPA